MRKKLSVLLLILMLIMNQAAPMGIKAADAADEVKVYVKMEKAVLRKVTEPPKDRIKIYVRP